MHVYPNTYHSNQQLLLAQCYFLTWYCVNAADMHEILSNWHWLSHHILTSWIGKRSWLCSMNERTMCLVLISLDSFFCGTLISSRSSTPYAIGQKLSHAIYRKIKETIHLCLVKFKSIINSFVTPLLSNCILFCYFSN